jgi:hypothetical protein
MSVEFDVQIAKNGGGSYPGARFSYRDTNGALKEQGFHNNALKFNPALKNQLSQLEVGKPFTMVKEKEGEFWNVKAIYNGDVAPSQAPSSGTAKAPTATPSASPKSNYETPEERAQRQVYIIRQSAVNYAVNAAGLLKLKTKEEIVGLAKFFEAYVMDTKFDDGSIMSLESDDIDVE